MIRLTKKRLARLNAEISVDDLLYEKFRRLNEDLKRETVKLYRAKQVVRVIQRRDNINVVLQILDIEVSPEGTTVICQ